jgi:hypothetical protein
MFINNMATDTIINDTYDTQIVSKLNDAFFLSRCNQSAPTIRNRATLNKILLSYKIRKATRERICDRAVPLLVPPGVKASFRGSQLNKLINQRLTRLVKKIPGVSIVFEQSHKKISTVIHERPDWLVTTKDGRMLVGFSQVALWGGGQQLNRGAKYVLDNRLHTALARKGITLVCVVAEKPKSMVATMSKASKLRKIMDIGIQKHRILYPKALETFIRSFAKKKRMGRKTDDDTQ